MADLNSNDSVYGKLYSDTNYFIDAIVAENSFYREFVDAVSRGGKEFEVKRRKLKKIIDEDWIDTIEENLISLDRAIRSPSKFIEEQEDVLPIEISHDIGARSLQHLSQHTDYIKEYDGENVTPSKILNVFREETMQTYENKFINTLINRLYIFVNKRYTELLDAGKNDNCVELDFSSDFLLGNSSGKIKFSVEVSEPEKTSEGYTVSDRIKKLNSIVTEYLNSDFVKTMGKSYVRPPIMRTNAITKNKDLRQCLLLWQFIESYEKIGYTIEAEESAEKPDESYINELYSTLALQYLLFKYKVSGNFDESSEVLEKTRADSVEPVFKTDLEELEIENQDVHDTVYRRVVPVFQPGLGKISSGDEQRIRAAVEVALEAEKLILARRLEEEEKRRAREAAKLAAEKQRLESRKFIEGLSDGKRSGGKSKKERMEKKREKMKSKTRSSI